MSYEQVASFTQTAALVLFVAIFYRRGDLRIFWPGNKKRFEKDAQIPLRKDPDQEGDY